MKTIAYVQERRKKFSNKRIFGASFIRTIELCFVQELFFYSVNFEILENNIKRDCFMPVRINTDRNVVYLKFIGKTAKFLYMNFE